jgi:cytochrome b subunit of formate dehydrogenase
MFTIQTMFLYLCILKLYHARPCAHARLCMLFLIIAGHNIVFQGILIRTSLFTAPLVSCSNSTTDYAMVSQIRYLLERATRVLWHQRLRHVHVRRLSGLHKYVDGIPAIKLRQYI